MASPSATVTERAPPAGHRTLSPRLMLLIGGVALILQLLFLIPAVANYLRGYDGFLAQLPGGAAAFSIGKTGPAFYMPPDSGSAFSRELLRTGSFAAIFSAGYWLMLDRSRSRSASYWIVCGVLVGSVAGLLSFLVWSVPVWLGAPSRALANQNLATIFGSTGTFASGAGNGMAVGLLVGTGFTILLREQRRRFGPDAAATPTPSPGIAAPVVIGLLWIFVFDSTRFARLVSGSSIGATLLRLLRPSFPWNAFPNGWLDVRMSLPTYLLLVPLAFAAYNAYFAHAWEAGRNRWVTFGARWAASGAALTMLVFAQAMRSEVLLEFNVDRASGRRLLFHGIRYLQLPTEALAVVGLAIAALSMLVRKRSAPAGPIWRAPQGYVYRPAAGPGPMPAAAGSFYVPRTPKRLSPARAWVGAGLATMLGVFGTTAVQLAMALPDSRSNPSLPTTDPDPPQAMTYPTATGPACPTEEPFQCVAADSGDVDGDGAIDQVALYIEPPDLNPTLTVRVVYARGTTEEQTIDAAIAIALLGVTDLDGDGREEVAFLHDGGAHTSYGTFLGTAVTGQLHPVGFGVGEVVIDSSAAMDAGFSCPDLDGDGRPELVTTAVFVEFGQDIEVARTSYRWVDDRLEQIDQTVETIAGDIPSAALEDEAGAHCGDLSRWGG
ncbi:MAG TPA: VCBS repeat-containing protein [Acidimicrobiales bacterium]